jgi:hypothetical protein
MALLKNVPVIILLNECIHLSQSSFPLLKKIKRMVKIAMRVRQKNASAQSASYIISAEVL